MLVGPCRIAASAMDDTEDGVGADEIPRVDRTAAFAGIADELLGVDGGDATVGECRAGCATVYFGLVDVDAFLILAGSPGRSRAGSTGAGRESVAGGFGRGVEIPGICDVIVDSGQSRASAGDDRDEAREGVRRLRGAGGNVVVTGRR